MLGFGMPISGTGDLRPHHRAIDKARFLILPGHAQQEHVALLCEFSNRPKGTWLQTELCSKARIERTYGM